MTHHIERQHILDTWLEEPLPLTTEERQMTIIAGVAALICLTAVLLVTAMSVYVLLHGVGPW